MASAKTLFAFWRDASDAAARNVLGVASFQDAIYLYDISNPVMSLRSITG
jgi:hypothetical protein